MELKKKQGIAPVIKQLPVYKTATFSLSVYKYTVIGAAIQTIQSDSTMKFSKKKDRKSNTVEVTRIA